MPTVGHQRTAGPVFQFHLHHGDNFKMMMGKKPLETQIRGNHAMPHKYINLPNGVLFESMRPSFDFNLARLVTGTGARAVYTLRLPFCLN